MVKDEIYSVGKEEGTTGFSAKNTIFHYDFILTKLTVVQPDRHERATTVLIWKEDGGARCALELNNFTVSFLSSTMEAQGLEDNTTRFVLYSRSRIRKVIVCLGSTSSLPTGEDKQLAANIHPGQPLSIQFNGNEEAVFTVEEREVEEVDEDCDALGYVNLPPLHCNVCRQVLYNDPELSLMSTCINCHTVNGLTEESSGQLRRTAIKHMVLGLVCIFASIGICVGLILAGSPYTFVSIGLIVFGIIYAGKGIQLFCKSGNNIVAVGVHERDTLGVLVNGGGDEETGDTTGSWRKCDNDEYGPSF